MNKLFTRIMLGAVKPNISRPLTGPGTVLMLEAGSWENSASSLSFIRSQHWFGEAPVKQISGLSPSRVT
jgi:hypothetical protein